MVLRTSWMELGAHTGEQTKYEHTIDTLRTNACNGYSIWLRESYDVNDGGEGVKVNGGGAH